MIEGGSGPRPSDALHNGPRPEKEPPREGVEKANLLMKLDHKKNLLKALMETEIYLENWRGVASVADNLMMLDKQIWSMKL